MCRPGASPAKRLLSTSEPTLLPPLQPERGWVWDASSPPLGKMIITVQRKYLKNANGFTGLSVTHPTGVLFKVQTAMV